MLLLPEWFLGWMTCSEECGHLGLHLVVIQGLACLGVLEGQQMGSQGGGGRVAGPQLPDHLLILLLHFCKALACTAGCLQVEKSILYFAQLL